MNTLTKKLLVVLWIIFGYAYTLQAQTTRVNGRITDKETGEALPFVNVFFTGTKIGTTSDINGYYTLESYYAIDSVGASFVGYKRCLLYTSPSPRDRTRSRMPSSA